MFFLTSLMISGAYCWKTRNYSTLGMPIVLRSDFYSSSSCHGTGCLPGCAFPTLFPFFSSQACISDFCPRPRSDPCRNSTVLFPFPEQAVAILFGLRDVFRISPVISKQKCKMFQLGPNALKLRLAFDQAGTHPGSKGSHSSANDCRN
jgi:hypothetical protein